MTIPLFGKVIRALSVHADHVVEITWYDDEGRKLTERVTAPPKAVWHARAESAHPSASLGTSPARQERHGPDSQG